MSFIPVAWSVVFGLGLHAQSAPFDVTSDFPGGNILVENIEGNAVRVAPDLRENKVPWFYWNFAVRGAAGRKLTFVFPEKYVGVRGPGVSVDGGRSWQWMGADTVKEGVFSYPFPPSSGEVRFSNGMPYVRSDFDRFMQQYASNPNIHLGTLTRTPKGRDVPLLKVSAPGVEAKYMVAITARHHCSEMMASYVVEGLIQGALADDEPGRWLRQNVAFFIVPFADTDGVEDGDQGKNRPPHDHNRDYGKNGPIYNEVAAIKAQLPKWTEGRPMIFFDVHNPALKGGIHEVVQLLQPQEPDQAEQLARFASILERDARGPLLFRQDMIMKFGSGYNGVLTRPPPIASGWARTLPNTLLGISIELPFATSAGCEVNAATAREFGCDLARAVKGLFQEQSGHRGP